MSHEGHTKFLEDRLELVQASLNVLPGLDNLRDDLKDDLLEHVMSYVEGYEDAGQDFPVLQLVIEWFVNKTADSMSGADLDKMSKEYQTMPDHYKYLVE